MSKRKRKHEANALKALLFWLYWCCISQCSILLGFIRRYRDGLYLIVTGVIWSLFGLLVFWALWRGIAWAPKITIISTILYNLYFWFDRLLMPSYPQRNANAYFYLIVWSWIFAFTLWVTMSKKNKPFFGGFDG